MKDYYYFLGIPKNASSEDIKKAYRKLSLKYHPDKNQEDLFFEERFREVQEAYNTLIDEQSRKVYDFNFGHEKQSTRSQLPPSIKHFSANKIRVKKGDEIIINWQTSNADVVKILPFGLEKNYGERKFKITEFNNGKFHVVLQAMNTLLNKTVVQGITFTEVFETETQQKPQVGKNFVSQNDLPKSNEHWRLRKIVLFIGMIILIIILLKTLLH